MQKWSIKWPIANSKNQHKSLKYIYYFKKNGARGRNRTTDTRIFNPLLYP